MSSCRLIRLARSLTQLLYTLNLVLNRAGGHRTGGEPTWVQALPLGLDLRVEELSGVQWDELIVRLPLHDLGRNCLRCQQDTADDGQ